MEIKSKGNAIFDYTKFLLSIMIIALHTKFLPNVLNPWLRLAVPMFFVISSYFFFSKIGKSNSSSEKNKLFIHYVKRNMQLYLFWFVLLLPIIVYIRRWFLNGIVLGVLKMLRDFIFSSTFTASWYIMASIIATFLIYILSKKLSNGKILCIAALVYVIVCFFSGYRFLADKSNFLNTVMEQYIKLFTLPANSFPVALFWVACGKCFADGTFDKIFIKLNNKVGIVFCAILFYFEWWIVRRITNESSKDCYFMLICLVPFIFQLLKGINITATSKTIFLRKLSTVTYVLHGSAIHVLRKILRIINFEYNGLLLIMVFTCCLIATFLIMTLEKKKLFKWLKYAY